MASAVRADTTALGIRSAAPGATTASPEPILQIKDLHTYYGHAHALQGVTLTLERGVLGVVGRNGMGKSTLCNAIMGLVPAASGSVRVLGQEILGLAPHRIVHAGVSYVPQGRRVWPSLSVDEHLKLAVRSGGGPWTVERVYQAFPRLAERKRNGGAELSGGEQQMLAISRALLANPRLLVMDEPTEGLAPVVVKQLVTMLQRLVQEGEISVLLIEQNLGVATTLAPRIAVMVNGRVAHETSAVQLASDAELQQRFLGVRAVAAEEGPAAETTAPAAPAAEPVRVLQVRRLSQARADASLLAAAPAFSAARAPTLWSTANPVAERPAESSEVSGEEPALREVGGQGSSAPIHVSIGSVVGRAAYVAGTFDTKGRELAFIKSCLDKLGIRAVTVDLSTSQRPSPADIGPGEVARFHPKGRQAVFTGDRGTAVRAMSEAFERFIVTRRDLAGLIAAGGSGATSLATPAMRALPIGIPKVMVSTVASGDVKRYVGPSDICMIYSVTDVLGINRISEQVLSNAAHALAGMIAWSLSARRQGSRHETKPALGLTMFGVTTPCVQAVTKLLEDTYDCLVFHATGTGGQSMEKLVDSRLLDGVIDVSTTEVADLLMGGVFSAGEDRFGSIIRTRIPYVASCGALDMVNFGPIDTVPEHYKHRNLYQHNPSVTLMRTTPEENMRMGKWIADKLNQCEGPVRFLIPEGGVSLYDQPGRPFYDPQADAALFKSISENLRVTGNRRLIRLPYNINDPAFAAALVESFREVSRGLAAA
jgi:uncharacterized protein (UPF0261 family)/ABC-type branched-subunit amino acid transport system ATPase component